MKFLKRLFKRKGNTMPTPLYDSMTGALLPVTTTSIPVIEATTTDPVTGETIAAFTPTGNAAADAIDGVSTSIVAGAEAAAAPDTETKVIAATQAAAGFSEEVLAVLEDLGVVNSKLVSQGSSIASLLSRIASVFEGIKL